MNEVLKEYNNIEKNIRRNNFTVLGLIVLMISMVIIFSFFVYKTNTFYSNNRIILDCDGQVRQGKNTFSNQEALVIECKHHISMLYSTFYTYNQFNFDQQLNKGFWLGDESLRYCYKKYKDMNWYNNIIQYNVDQISEITDISVDVTEYPYTVNVKGVLVLRGGNSEEKYILSGSCFLKTTSRNFPNNPHGLFIVNWKETLEKSN